MKQISALYAILTLLVACGQPTAAALEGKYVCTSVAPADNAITLSEMERRGISNTQGEAIWLNIDGTFRLSSGTDSWDYAEGRYLLGPGDVLFMFFRAADPTCSRWDVKDGNIVVTWIYERQQHLGEITPLIIRTTFSKE